MLEGDINMRIIIYRKGDFWIAQCLEKDIMASSDKGIESLLSRLVLQVAMNEDLDFDPAPERFHKMWRSGEELYFSGQGFDIRQVA